MRLTAWTWNIHFGDKRPSYANSITKILEVAKKISAEFSVEWDLENWTNQSYSIVFNLSALFCLFSHEFKFWEIKL